MKKRIMFMMIVILLYSIRVMADEGMWIPLLLKKYTVEDMQKKGFKLTAEDIYDINKACLKDAVVGLGRDGRPFSHFCTGEIVSKQGLMLTNYHCSHSMIQSHTSLEHNYLRDGFWAKSKSDELANPGITASILIRIDDVTDEINSKLTDNMTIEERNREIALISKVLEHKIMSGTNLMANVKAYFGGNQFFMSVYKIYRDVRLVGAPPSSVGKFGGDTDNWAWPRHTGDFAVLRIYADRNNEPAAYSKYNKPYVPKTSMKISTRGIKEGDFTFVFGYPGTTVEYIPSFAIEEILNTDNPHKIAVRTAKIDVINEAMDKSELLRIKYSAKVASVSNAWKKWQGETKGLLRFNTLERKREIERNFREWASDKPKYANLIDKYRDLYGQRKMLLTPYNYASEAGVRGAEIIGFAISISSAFEKYDEAKDKIGFKENLKEYIEGFYKDWDYDTDKNILKRMLELYNNNVDADSLPKEVAFVNRRGLVKTVDKYFRKSILTNPDKMNDVLEDLGAKSLKKINKDKIVKLAKSIYSEYRKYGLALSRISRKIKEVDRLWIKGLMEMQPNKNFYPDANSSLRVSYGKVGGYEPLDGIKYNYRTTLDGILEKENPNIYDYNVADRLKTLYRTKNYGEYADFDGRLPVCFLASNHTTGGNSGSPVLDADGYLIGINFDRAWDGVMSDMQYDPNICRNIAVDIRYVLFMIDKFAGATHIIDEMEIIR